LGYVFFNIRAKCVDKMLGFKVITKLFKIKRVPEHSSFTAV